MNAEADVDLRLTEKQGLLESQIQAINRFPDQNPHPVMRISDDGILTYANVSSEPVRQVLGVSVGDRVPENYLRLLRDAALTPGERVEIVSGVRTYALLPVPVLDLGFINVYGTDITAEKVVAKFPGQNPNPVLRSARGAGCIYANDASAPIVEALGLRVGEPLPDEPARRHRRRLDDRARPLERRPAT